MENRKGANGNHGDSFGRDSGNIIPLIFFDNAMFFLCSGCVSISFLIDRERFGRVGGGI
jgi:hypothetical protein